MPSGLSRKIFWYAHHLELRGIALNPDGSFTRIRLEDFPPQFSSSKFSPSCSRKPDPGKKPDPFLFIFPDAHLTLGKRKKAARPIPGPKAAPSVMADGEGSTVPRQQTAASSCSCFCPLSGMSSRPQAAKRSPMGIHHPGRWQAGRAKQIPVKDVSPASFYFLTLPDMDSCPGRFKNTAPAGKRGLSFECRLF